MTESAPRPGSGMVDRSEGFGERLLGVLLDRAHEMPPQLIAPMIAEEVARIGGRDVSVLLQDYALDAMHRDPAAPWTVATLATEAGLSRAAFARRFTALVGQPPLGYLTWWRMTTAARLLKTTDAPLRAVASQVGYVSEFAFAHAFKRTHHTAPGKYRAQNDQATTPARVTQDG